MLLMNLFSGHRIDPLHIKEDDIYLEDIAHALSLICRGNGHIKYFYSVAQHSLNCAKEAQSRGYSKHVVLSCFPPFPRAFVARTQIYNQTQIHQNSSVPLDIIV